MLRDYCTTMDCANSVAPTVDIIGPAPLKEEDESICTSSSDSDEDTASDVDDEGVEVVKDLNYWKEQAAKSGRVSTLLCDWFRSKSIAMDNLTSSSTEKIQFLENELARVHASTSEKAGLVANETLRERISNTRQLVESTKAYNAVVREGKRAQEVITKLEADTQEMEESAADLAAFHEANSVPKRKRRRC